MKSIVIQNEKFQKLVSDYDTALEENGYSPETRKGHVRILRQIWALMDSGGVSDYSPSIGKDYLQDYQSSHSNQETCEVVKAIVKKFNVFYTEGFVPPNDKSVFYNPSLQSLMDCLEKELRAKGYH